MAGMRAGPGRIFPMIIFIDKLGHDLTYKHVITMI